MKIPLLLIIGLALLITFAGILQMISYYDSKIADYQYDIQMLQNETDGTPLCKVQFYGDSGLGISIPLSNWLVKTENGLENKCKLLERNCEYASQCKWLPDDMPMGVCECDTNRIGN